MAETDLGRIVGMIMENPALVEQIKAMGRGDEGVAEAAREETPASEPTSAPPRAPRHSRKTELLCALKPFVSEGRRKALDSMLSLFDVIDAMKGGS